MNEFENTNFEDTNPEEKQAEPVIREERPEPQPYQGAGAGRKESPFADSPYVTYEPEIRDGYTAPTTVKKNRGTGKGWKITIAAVLAAAVLGGSVAGTAAVAVAIWLGVAAVAFAISLESVDGGINTSIDVYEEYIFSEEG